METGRRLGSGGIGGPSALSIAVFMSFLVSLSGATSEPLLSLLSLSLVFCELESPYAGTIVLRSSRLLVSEMLWHVLPYRKQSESRCEPALPSSIWD
jgi:hypothetical protein